MLKIALYNATENEKCRKAFIILKRQYHEIFDLHLFS
jgi:hypothetical protein